jgi:hypothetical protein
VEGFVVEEFEKKRLRNGEKQKSGRAEKEEAGRRFAGRKICRHTW